MVVVVVASSLDGSMHAMQIERGTGEHAKLPKSTSLPSACFVLCLVGLNPSCVIAAGKTSRLPPATAGRPETRSESNDGFVVDELSPFFIPQVQQSAASAPIDDGWREQNLMGHAPLLADAEWESSKRSAGFQHAQPGIMEPPVFNRTSIARILSNSVQNISEPLLLDCALEFHHQSPCRRHCAVQSASAHYRPARPRGPHWKPPTLRAPAMAQFSPCSGSVCPHLHPSSRA